MVNITGQECTTIAAPVTKPTVTPMKPPLRHAPGPLCQGSFDFLDAPPAAGAAAAAAPADPPTMPKVASFGRYFSMTSGGWIMSNSSVASFPAKVRIASSPPGCCDKKLVTLRTLLFTTTQQSVFVVCLATSDPC